MTKPDLRAQILAGAHKARPIEPDVPVKPQPLAAWTAERGRWFRFPWAMFVSLFNIAAAAASILVGVVVVIVWFLIHDASRGLTAAFWRVFANWPGLQLPRSLHVAWAFGTKPQVKLKKRES